MPRYRNPLALLLPLFTLLFASTTWSAEFQLNSGKQQTTLIELFTSQGCNSCPPAERWLGSLQQDPRLWKEIIPVAFHVDYWDYIGWKDRFAKPAFSARQRRYQSENGIRTVYTPGFVVNGMEWRRWFGLRNIPLSKTKTGELKLKLADGALQVDFEQPGSGVRPLVLNVAVLGVGMVTAVTRGENAGRKLPQDFVVLQHRYSKSENGQWHIDLPLPSPDQGARLALAAWVSPIDRLKPLQAVGGWLPTE